MLQGWIRGRCWPGPTSTTGGWKRLRARKEGGREQAGRLRLFNRLEKALQDASSTLASMHPNTRNSVLRGLRRAARYVSSWLDQGLYRLLTERVADGFTIVHLAPPSIGDTDPAIARLLEELYNDAVERFQPGRTTLLVVEEAHNLAPAGEEKASGRALLRIAREGRKWGLSLVLVSQRPGFIDQGVLSQTATLVALRITNPEDIAGLRRGSESTSQELLEHLPDLDRGQAIAAGLALPERRVPTVVTIEKLARVNKQCGGADTGGEPVRNPQGQQQEQA